MHKKDYNQPAPLPARVYVCAKCGRKLGLPGDPPAVKIGVANTPHGPKQVYAHKECPQPEEQKPGTVRLRVRFPKGDKGVRP